MPRSAAEQLRQADAPASRQRLRPRIAARAVSIGTLMASLIAASSPAHVPAFSAAGRNPYSHGKPGYPRRQDRASRIVLRCAASINSSFFAGRPRMSYAPERFEPP